MTSDHSMEVQLGNVRVEVPICVDRETTERLVQRVNERLSEIEERSTRIDTHMFALKAALSFAAEVEDGKMDSDEESTAIMVQLDQVNDTLEALLRDIE